MYFRFITFPLILKVQQVLATNPPGLSARCSRKFSWLQFDLNRTYDVLGVKLHDRIVVSTGSFFLKLGGALNFKN